MKSDQRLKGAAVWLCFGLLMLIVIQRIAETASTTDAIRQSQVTNSTTLNTSAQVLHLIRDCVNPNGACYQRAQRQTANAVSNINRVIILAAACSAGLPPHLSVPSRQAEIQSCVINRLAAHAHH